MDRSPDKSKADKVFFIIGEYLGKVFIEAKHRPVYLINRMEGVEKRAKSDL